MESFFVRYRNLVVLLAVLVAQIAGLAMQVRRNEGGNTSLDANDTRGMRLIRYWAESVVAPPERLIHGARLGIENLWTGYFDLRHVRQQNMDLQKTVDRLRLEQAELLQDAQQGQRLQAMLGFQQHYIYSTVAAQVFGTSGTDQAKLFYIDKGSAEGLKRDMPVISANGIVGKVRDVFPHSAQVLEINDQTSGAGVILETTRIRGILKGNAAGQLEIVGLLADQRIKPGEKVLTAGGDLIFPRGLPVGTVQKVVPDPERDSFIDVIVTPAANLDQLDEVLIISSTQPRFPAQEQQDIATSEEQKGAEAAAVEAQMKASQIMAERLPGLNDANTPGGTAAPANGQTGTPAAGQATPGEPPGPRLLTPMRPDRFTPGVAAPAVSPSTPETSQPSQAPKPSSQPQPGRATGAGEDAIAMSLLGADYRRDFEIHRYPLIVNALVPLAALVLQSWLPRPLGRWALFDLPLIVTVYFALGRRSPIQGTLLGAAMGLFEDALTHHAIGLNGIAKTLVGFLSASVGLRIDVENQAIRAMLNFQMSLLSSVIYLFVARVLLGLEFEWNWLAELFKAVDNSVIALVLFPMLDRLQVRE